MLYLFGVTDSGTNKTVSLCNGECVTIHYDRKKEEIAGGAGGGGDSVTLVGVK